MGEILGSLGHIPSYFHSSPGQKVPVLPSRQSSVQISSPPIRTAVSSLGLRQSDTTVEKMDDIQRDHTIPISRRLGLLLNFQKSELTPTQSITFLGERLGLHSAITYPTQERRTAIHSMWEKVNAQGHLIFLQAESFLGLLSATSLTIPLGRLHLRTLQHQVIRIIRKGRSPRAIISLSGKLSQDLQ